MSHIMHSTTNIIKIKKLQMSGQSFLTLCQWSHLGENWSECCFGKKLGETLEKISSLILCVIDLK